jgi:chemotaxis protein MotA
MFIILGYLIVCGSIYGGFAISGGHLAHLFQPIILFMVGGAAQGFFIAANDIHTMRQVILALPSVFKSSHAPGNTLYTLTQVLSHLSSGKPEAAADVVRIAINEQRFARVLDPAVVGHMAESVRLAGLPGMVAVEFARMSETDLQSCLAETDRVTRAICNVGHIMVAMGFVVTVLGVIHAGYLSDHAEYMIILSHSLVGIFLGILIGWGFVLPVAHKIKANSTMLQMQYRCINLAIGAHLRGLPPAVALEAGRMALSPDLRPAHTNEDDEGTQP